MFNWSALMQIVYSLVVPVAVDVHIFGDGVERLSQLQVGDATSMLHDLKTSDDVTLSVSKSLS